MYRSLPARLLTLLSFFVLFQLSASLSTNTPSNALRKRAPVFQHRQVTSNLSSASSASATSSSSTSAPSPPPTSSSRPVPVSSSARPLSSSTPVTIPSSSNTVTSSSTSSRIIATNPVVIATVPNPRTTFSLPTQTITESVDPTDEPSEPTESSAPSSAKSFWQNKAAVAGTFSVLSILLIGVIFAVGTFAVRRRGMKAKNEEYFDKYPEPNVTDDVSTHDMLTPARSDAYPDRGIHYGGPNSTGSETYHTQQGYSSPDAYAQQYAQNQYTGGEQYAQHHSSAEQYGEQQYPYTSGEQNVAQNYQTNYQPNATNAEAGAGQHQYNTSAPYETNHGPSAYPAASQSQGNAVFVGGALRNAPGRDSYQQSIDSFYGATAR